MKNLILALLLLLCSCGTTEQSKKSEPIQVNQAFMQQTATSLVSKFTQSLKSELMLGMKNGGFANAISACQVQAPQIADSFSSQHWSIKRVTEKPRNKMNQASEHETDILNLFADSSIQLEFFDEWSDTQDKTDYYFYKPIYAGKFCLKCHGTIDELNTVAVEKINENYPDDKAVDYFEGDIRGMFVVHIKNKVSAASLHVWLKDSL